MIKLVKAGPQDAVELARARQTAWKQTYRGIYPDEMLDQYDMDYYAARDRGRMGEAGQHYYLFMDGNVCAGYFSFGPTHYQRHKDFELYINNLYILEPYKGQGLGRRAFLEIREYCKIAGFEKFCCGCNAHNAPAMAFYRHMGGVQAYAPEYHPNKADDIVHFEFYLGESV